MTDAIKCNNCGAVGEPEKQVFANVRLSISNPKAWDYLPTVTPMYNPMTKFWGARVQIFDLCKNCLEIMMKGLEARQNK